MPPVTLVAVTWMVIVVVSVAVAVFIDRRFVDLDDVDVITVRLVRRLGDVPGWVGLVILLYPVFLLDWIATLRIQRVRASLVHFPARISAERSAPKNALRFIRYFFRGEARETIDDCYSELLRDARAMAREHFPRWKIYLVVNWQALRCMVPIVWNGTWEALKAALPMLRLLDRLWGRFQ